MKSLLKVFSILFLIILITPQQAKASADYTSIVKKIHGCSYTSAKQDIANLIQANPEDPYAYLLRGMYYEWQQVTRNKGKSLDSRILAEYEKANELAEQQYDKNPNSIEAKATLSNTYIYLAKKQIDQGKKMKAGSTLKKAKKLMLDVIKKDPNNKSALFSVGLFNYFADNVPSGLKWLASLLGFNGNETLGLNYIKQVANSDHFLSSDAKFMLIHIFSRVEYNKATKDYEFTLAYPYAESLYSRYPGNNFYTFLYGEMSFRVGNYSTSRSVFNRLLDHCNRYKSHCSQQNLFLTNLFVAWGYINEKNYAAAKPYVLEANRLIGAAGTKDRKQRVNDFMKKIK
ncbi:MAG: tetratricopeptide repeat protein [bacterium]|nr:hypothetical protein [bacterium]MBU1917205.1 hypothetical protein [bacterium]